MKGIPLWIIRVDSVVICHLWISWRLFGFFFNKKIVFFALLDASFPAEHGSKAAALY
jgi:hypothetical protein